MFGIRKAARNASAAYDRPKKWLKIRSLMSPKIRLRKIPAAAKNAEWPIPGWAAGSRGVVCMLSDARSCSPRIAIHVITEN